jgi:predicted enzyme related to lactoylglutathione lyase
MSKHKIVHIEFAAKDPRASATFYAEVFGWKYQEMPEMNYITFDTEADLGGGFPETDGEMMNPGDVIVYIDTDDIPASLVKIEAAGGKTLMPQTEIPEMGWFAFFEDPAGNRVALYKSMTPG